jgi:hypothetical protein
MTIGRSFALVIVVAVMLPMFVIGCGGTGPINHQQNNPSADTPTYAAPAAITYGTALSATQLDASCPVTASTLTYNQTVGAVLAAGAQTLTATCTPSDTTDFYAASTNVTLTVNKAKDTPTYATPAAITYGTALSATQLNASCPVTASTASYNQTAGIVLAAGAQTLTATCTPTDATDYAVDTANVTLTVNKAASVITWPTPASITNAATLASALDATANTNGSFAFTATLAGGSPVAVTPATVLTTTGSYTLTATFTPTDAADYTAATATVPLTVTLAPPTIVAIDKNYVYCEVSGLGCYAQFNLTTANILVTDTLTVGPISIGGNVISWGGTGTSNQAWVKIYFNTYSPGWYTFQLCRADKVTCSNVVATAFLAAQNTLAVSEAGELFQLDQTKTTVTGDTAFYFYVYKFKANGSTTLTADENFSMGLFFLPFGISYDDTTSVVDIGGSFYDANGNLKGGFGESTSTTGPLLGTATRNGYGASTQPASNNFFGYPTSGNPTVTPITMGCQPSSLRVGTVSTETDALVLSRDCAVTLWKQSLSGSTPESSMPLTGITPSSTVWASNAVAGGWQVAYAETGPAVGTVAILSTPDAIIDFASATTMKESPNPATLAGLGIPTQIASDGTHGTFIVAFANPQTAKTTSSTTTFASVNPTTGTVTALKSTSALLAAGFAVSADGNWLYVCSRSACEMQPNQ